MYQEYLPYIDVTGGLARLMNSKKLFAKLLRSYLATTSFESMSAPLSEGNFEAAQVAVHSFKGVSANLSLTQNYELSKALEAVIKEKSDYTAALAALKASMLETEPLINKLISFFEQP